MRIGALIKALGGPTAVGRTLGLRVSAVGNWTMRDAIPREHHLAVWRLATAKNIVWTPPDAEGLVLTPAGPPAQPASSSPRGEAA